eukprot:2534587-Rhodomonas_salina.1
MVLPVVPCQDSAPAQHQAEGHAAIRSCPIVLCAPQEIADADICYAAARYDQTLGGDQKAGAGELRHHNSDATLRTRWFRQRKEEFTQQGSGFRDFLRLQTPGFREGGPDGVVG